MGGDPSAISLFATLLDKEGLGEVDSSAFEIETANISSIRSKHVALPLLASPYKGEE